VHDLPYPVTDIHVHIQPWQQLHPGAQDVMSSSRPDYQNLATMMHDPAAVLARMDEDDIDRIGMINYVAPRLMGFTDNVNEWSANISKADPRRLLAFGGLDPRDPAVINDPAGAVDRLVDLGIRALKIHPPHQELRANAYRNGAAEEHLPALEGIYGHLQEVEMPLMIHTGTSVFPGARSRYGDPMDCDDIGIDFPELTMILAHCGRPMWTQGAIFVIRRFPSAYIDLSSIPPKRLLYYIPMLENLANKCLWGTDWPGPGAPTMDHNVTEFLDLDLSDETRKLILHDNAATLFPDR
jgi:predicted TIM-barrel fold metal-dependent hydrolase